MKKWLLGMTPDEIKKVVAELALPSYTAGQIVGWIYKKKVSEIDEMTNLSKLTRTLLDENYQIGGFKHIKSQLSLDGTRKYLFPTINGTPIESVMIPDDDRRTLCVSSQSGCKMGCKFCMTGRMGFKGNLSAGEIVSQFLKIEERDELTNAVFMGMGEPLDNYAEVMKAIEIITSEWGFGWSPKRITLSSIGLTPQLKDFLDNSKCHLAISLHNPFDSERLELMPMQKAWPVEETIELIRDYDFSGQRRVSFEYIMFDGWNDNKRHADALTRLLRGLECRINLIRFHSIPDFPLKTSPLPIMEMFKERLNRAGIVTTIRSSRGEDIMAACGMLSGNNSKN
ncbi:MAG: 23S rRNA (adenine(2503)-C(2))-methyltransferase RlmN [Bacteroidales bacterium]|jgi:23S rRNA (adenine2503-C2)-methyltransferase|nr:23S rRNA (adenine(2503)-C(2))-methyltransferase RlmN [Bacteroidales bacterium]MDD3273279.1 23S rRNA (adenine(2503)-C(2))-methyltransferase RlmN [Bacteroidales bacterium]MDD4057561.1 23S rRNA (adenine(2503)-C(2))-methyltransferase RlmN [Bacteroidales bacterium]